MSSVALSVGGVAVAVMLKAPVHGGRGGALATALALTGLFATRNSSGLVYTALTDTTLRVRTALADLKGGSQAPPLTADERLQAFETRLRMDAEGARIQNAFMACSTAVATVFWGFGDMFADWSMAFIGG